MGLDAVVYMSKRRVDETFGVSVSERCPMTGEPVSVANGALPRRREMTACAERIGNTALVAWLREHLAALLPASSIVLSRVLYSGSHCGDVIDVADVAILRRELTVLSRHDDQDVRTFAQRMERLATASLAEGNPIVFT